MGDQARIGRDRPVRQGGGWGALVACLALLVVGQPPPAQAQAQAAMPSTEPSVEWAVSAGPATPQQEIFHEAGSGVAVDTEGNATVTGTFRGAMTFGSGDDEVTLHAAGESGVFVARYHSDGALDWAVSLGGPGFDVAHGVAVDPGGSVVVTGAFGAGFASTTATFGSGDREVTLTSAGFSDLFVARYHPEGGLDWAISAGGPGLDSGHAVSTDAAGNVVVTGTSGSDAVVWNGQPEATGGGLLLARYERDGTLDWALGHEGAHGTGVAVDTGGGAVITGTVRQETTFGAGGAARTVTPAGYTDALVARFHADGTLDWISTAGDDGRSTGSSGVAVDAAGNAIITGWSFEGDMGGVGEEVFVARYRPDGSRDWDAFARGTGPVATQAVAVDAAGNAFVTGYFTGEVVIGSGEQARVLESVDSGNDVLVARFHADGVVDWATSAGSRSAGGGAVAVGPDGHAVVTGHFSESLTFGSGDDQVMLTSALVWDMFLARYVSVPASVRATPATRDQCMRGGHADFGFRNQGQCLRFVNTGQDPR